VATFRNALDQLDDECKDKLCNLIQLYRLSEFNLIKLQANET